jgi:hypothetical protein
MVFVRIWAFRPYVQMVMATQHCVQERVLGTLQHMDMCQADVPIQRHVNMISSFLMELQDCHTRTHFPDCSVGPHILP